MSIIAQDTGGQFFRVGVNSGDLKLRDAFSYTRTAFTLDTNHHLIKNDISPESKTILKNVMRSLFLALWCILSGVFIVIFLNNNQLLKHFLIPKIIVSVVCGVAFTVIMISIDSDAGSRIARALLAASMCIMYLPTYRWD
jgi:FtsH-binding integral membrane protein